MLLLLLTLVWVVRFDVVMDTLSSYNRLQLQQAPATTSSYNRLRRLVIMSWIPGTNTIRPERLIDIEFIACW